MPPKASMIDQLKQSIYGDGPGELSVESIYGGLEDFSEDDMRIMGAEEPTDEEMDEDARIEELKVMFLEKARRRSEQSRKFQQMIARHNKGGK